MRILFILLILFTRSTLAQTDYSNQVITDPAVSDRCKDLLIQKNEKVGHKQRINTLMKRTEKLLKNNTDAKRTAVSTLQVALKKLKQEQYLSTLKIKVIEEDIVRKGCPGLLL